MKMVNFYVLLRRKEAITMEYSNTFYETLPRATLIKHTKNTVTVTKVKKITKYRRKYYSSLP